MLDANPFVSNVTQFLSLFLVQSWHWIELRIRRNKRKDKTAVISLQFKHMIQHKFGKDERESYLLYLIIYYAFHVNAFTY